MNGETERLLGEEWGCSDLRFLPDSLLGLIESFDATMFIVRLIATESDPELHLG